MPGKHSQFPIPSELYQLVDQEYQQQYGQYKPVTETLFQKPHYHYYQDMHLPMHERRNEPCYGDCVPHKVTRPQTLKERLEEIKQFTE